MQVPVPDCILQTIHRWPSNLPCQGCWWKWETNGFKW